MAPQEVQAETSQVTTSVDQFKNVLGSWCPLPPCFTLSGLLLPFPVIISESRLTA